MKMKEVEYSRTFNLGEYESERIGLKAELDEAEDLDEAFRNIKERVLRLHEGSRMETDIDRLRDSFSDEWQQRLEFTSNEKYFKVKPKHYLGSDKFGELASVIRNLGGEYVSADKDSHFRIPIKGKS
ncbi:MAG: hypothetical protein OEZ48_09550 [Candidatus Bathyarchaeota archaeon]|nr:hypothetical protein [Candidatus Bathyarchaeota archaeon]MDH5688088.1 hypothetical protein [Candidatus Bathyarchaeota archaeon]